MLNDPYIYGQCVGRRLVFLGLSRPIVAFNYVYYCNLDAGATRKGIKWRPHIV